MDHFAFKPLRLMSLKVDAPEEFNALLIFTKVILEPRLIYASSGKLYFFVRANFTNDHLGDFKFDSEIVWSFDINTNCSNLSTLYSCIEHTCNHMIDIIANMYKFQRNVPIFRTPALEECRELLEESIRNPERRQS